MGKYHILPPQGRLGGRCRLWLMEATQTTTAIDKETLAALLVSQGFEATFIRDASREGTAQSVDDSDRSSPHGQTLPGQKAGDISGTGAYRPDDPGFRLLEDAADDPEKIVSAFMSYGGPGPLSGYVGDFTVTQFSPSQPRAEAVTMNLQLGMTTVRLVAVDETTQEPIDGAVPFVRVPGFVRGIPLPPTEEGGGGTPTPSAGVNTLKTGVAAIVEGGAKTEATPDQAAVDKGDGAGAAVARAARRATAKA